MSRYADTLAATFRDTLSKCFTAYKDFCKTFKLAWEPPKVRVERKVPFIPTEVEIDTLIAGCGRKTAAFLQVLKDTGARGSEFHRKL
jgi:hypothetical protein